MKPALCPIFWCLPGTPRLRVWGNLTVRHANCHGLSWCLVFTFPCSPVLPLFHVKAFFFFSIWLLLHVCICVNPDNCGFSAYTPIGDCRWEGCVLPSDDCKESHQSKKSISMGNKVLWITALVINWVSWWKWRTCVSHFMVIHPIVMRCFIKSQKMSTCCWQWRKSQGFRIYPLGNMNSCTKLYGIPLNNHWHISVWATTLAWLKDTLPHMHYSVGVQCMNNASFIKVQWGEGKTGERLRGPAKWSVQLFEHAEAVWTPLGKGR